MVMKMELYNGNIRVGQILKEPKAKAIFAEEFPDLYASPLIAMASNMTLSQVLNLAKGRIDGAKVNRLLRRLKEI